MIASRWARWSRRGPPIRFKHIDRSQCGGIHRPCGPFVNRTRLHSSVPLVAVGRGGECMRLGLVLWERGGYQAFAYSPESAEIEAFQGGDHCGSEKPRLATGDGLGLQHQVVFVRWGGLPEFRPMRGDIDGLLSAACMGVGRSLQACYATRGSVGLFHDGHPSIRAVGILAGVRRSLVCCMQVAGISRDFVRIGSHCRPCHARKRRPVVLPGSDYRCATPLSAPGGPWIFLSQSETWSAWLPVD